MTAVALPRRVPGPLVWLAVGAALAAGAVGALALPDTPVPPLPDRFGGGELLVWSLLAAATGGLVFGPRDRRPPVLASGLVGAAALLGAGPAACAVVAIAGALGGLRRLGGMPWLRVAAAALGGWAVPGLLALAATAGGPVLGRGLPIQLAEVVVLWGLLAVVIPAVEAVGTRLVLPPGDEVGIRHMLRRRLEPQTVLAALAVVAALAYAAIGPAAGLVVLLPAAAASIGFARHDDGRRAVSQTLAAMTVLPEWVGIVEVGHTARVRDAVEQVAVAEGWESRARRDLVRAAELHELGHLDGGIVRGDRGRVARSGAAVLEQAAVRPRVVAILEATAPDRVTPHDDPLVARAAQVLHAACELDRSIPLVDPVNGAARVGARTAEARRTW